MALCTLTTPFRKAFDIFTTEEKVHSVVESALVDQLSPSEYFITCNGRRVSDEDAILDGHCYHVCLRLPGGKGGFGSMLRALGAQIEKTTNREACRDLSGRRMRDINNEKKLREWAAKASDREKAKEERRRERRERLKARATARHKFSDPQFDKQKADIAERIDDALEEGLQKAGPSGTTLSATSGSKKRKGAAETVTDPKKAKNWLGLDVDADIGSLSSSDSDSEPKAETDMPCSDILPCAEESSSSSGGARCSSSLEPQTAADLGENDNTSGDEEHLQDKNDSVAVNVDGKTTTEPHQDDVQVAQGVETNCGTKSCSVEESSHSTLISGESLNLDDYDSAKSLEELGLDVLKVALMARGLKCGGTLDQRAERLFSVKGLAVDQINPALFAKPQKKK